MNFSFTKRIGTIWIALMMGCMNAAVAQCGFSALQNSGCQGFYLDLTDTTPGIVCPASGAQVSWNVQLPGSCGTIHTTGSCQFSYSMSCPGIVTVTMIDTVAGHPCTVTKSNITVNPLPSIQGTFSTSVTCAGDVVCWNDASIAGSAPGIICTIDSLLGDWNNSGPITTSLHPCVSYASNGVL